MAALFAVLAPPLGHGRHEIRTPLTAIIRYAELLSLPDPDGLHSRERPPPARPPERGARPGDDRVGKHSGPARRARWHRGHGARADPSAGRRESGDFTVESRPGEGSRFTLRLPASPSRVHLHAPATAAARTVPGVGNAVGADRALAITGQILLVGVDEIVRRHIEALRADPFFVRVDMMTDVQVADHEATFLADIAQSLLILAHAERVSLQAFRHASTVAA